MRRPLGDVLSTGALAGVYAGLAAGAIDAIWSWVPAAQFAHGFLSRLRFVAYNTIAHGAAGLALGFVICALLVGLSRGTRLGNLMRFAFADHRARREADPRVTVVGLSIVLAGLPSFAVALFVAYRATLPFVTGRHELGLVVVVAMAAAIAAIAVATVAAFVIGRAIEVGLAAAAPKLRALSSVWAPFVAAGVLVALAAFAWAAHDWDTARVLPLRAPIVLALGFVLAIPASRLAERTLARVARFATWQRRAGWVALPIALVAAMLGAGSSPAVIKAAAMYTGLGGPIAHAVRAAVDRDGDGFSPLLGGGDCDDSDASVHPGAPEIPDDGIDQNCVGGDASLKYAKTDTAFAPVPPTVPADFNVILITIDTTRADHLGAYGYSRPTSPSLDKLAADGTLFVNGWAHAPSTRYSMPAILTGRLPLDVYYDTSVSGWPGLSMKATTIAELLQPLGFATGAITNYEYFERYRHMDQGFAEYDNEDAKLHTALPGAGPAHTHGSSSKQQSDKAIAFVDKHAADRFFLWVHYYDPHYDYMPHPEVPSFGKEPIDLYDGEIRFTDMHIGRVIDELRAKGLYDKTVIVVTGDHGEGFGEHGVFEHGYHLYSAQTKVPLIIRVPGVPARKALTPAGHIDIMPTLVNLAGGKPIADMMGRSLVDVIAGKDFDRTVFQQLSYEGNHEMRGGVDEHCHVIYNISPDTSWEAYLTASDPDETDDVSEDDDCDATRTAVEHWYDASQIPAGATDALLHERPTIASPLDADLGTSIRLLSVDAPAKAKPGEQIDVTWTFEARGRVAAGWKLFVHLDGPNKAFVNGDHAPAWRFEWWRPGEFIRYKTSITLPRAPVGRYVMHVGLFRGSERIHVTAPHAEVKDDAVAAATIEVAP